MAVAAVERKTRRAEEGAKGRGTGAGGGTAGRTDADARLGERQKRQQLGYFAATLTEEVTVKYTAVARRLPAWERDLGLSHTHNTHTHTHAHTHTHRTTLGYSVLAVPLMKELNRQNLRVCVCVCVCVCVSERERGEGHRQAAKTTTRRRRRWRWRPLKEKEVVYLDDGGRLERSHVASRRRHPPPRRKTSSSLR